MRGAIFELLLPQTLLLGADGDGAGDGNGDDFCLAAAAEAVGTTSEELDADGRRPLLLLLAEPLRFVDDADDESTGVLADRLDDALPADSEDSLGKTSVDEMEGAGTAGELLSEALEPEPLVTVG